MSKASRERERIRDEKFGRKKESIVSKVCRVLKKDKSFDEKLDILNHMIIGTPENDWKLRLKDKGNIEEFDKKFDFRNFSGMVVPSIRENELKVRALGFPRDIYEKLDQNTSEEEMLKFYERHKIEFDLTFKTPLGIGRILNSLGPFGEQLIANN